MASARGEAEAAAAVNEASALWEGAEVQAEEGRQALTTERYAEARSRFADAAEAYGRAAAAAREAADVRRRAQEGARAVCERVEHDAALACETAVAAGAAEHAPGPFADGETHQRPARGRARARRARRGAGAIPGGRRRVPRGGHRGGIVAGAGAAGRRGGASGGGGGPAG